MPQHPPIELRGSAPIIGSGPIASAPDAGGYPAGVMWWDNVTGITWKNTELNKYDAALNSLCPYYNLSQNICFVKHRNDYKEYSVYVPIDSTGTRFARLYFSNRLNVGNNGLPRLCGALYAGLSGVIGVNDFTQNNSASYISNTSAFVDMLEGYGNVEYAVLTRKDSGSLAGFVTGTHGNESLVSFKLQIDGAEVDYASIPSSKTVCKTVSFEARCLVGYPSDTSTHWMEIVYYGLISAGTYNVRVKTNVILQSEVNIEYACMIMGAGSTSTQKYGNGTDIFEIDDSTYTLNTFNDAVNIIPGFKNVALRNYSFLVTAKYPDYKNIATEFLSNKQTSGRYVSRVDNLNKAYAQSTDEKWQTVPVGYGNDLTSIFNFRHGDSTSFDWSNNAVRKQWLPL